MKKFIFLIICLTIWSCSALSGGEIERYQRDILDKYLDAVSSATIDIAAYVVKVGSFSEMIGFIWGGMEHIGDV